MKIRKKRNVSEESYWKSFTDIMAGLLLVILLVVMLLLLLLTQMNEDEHSYDYQYETSYEQHVADDYDRFKHEYDHQNDNASNDSGGGGGGSGEDDPGTKDNEGIYVDVGHDKTAVFVTVVDEETGNVIKKDGTLFELYSNRNASGGLLTLHTYYPIKTEYKQYETTEAGTFFLPEKITKGWYSLHNLKAPQGYGLAEDVTFEIDESRDWSDPFLVEVPMAPAKSVIFIQNVDVSTNENIPGGTYEVFASEDIVTLDGTIRYRSGEKVDKFTCDKKGSGKSIKLYLGKYTVKQSAASEFYALNSNSIPVTLEQIESEAQTFTVKCEKTKAVFTLTDEYTEEPIKGAVFSVTDKEDELTTNADGKISVTDLKKSATYTVTLKSLPEPYRYAEEPIKFTVDGNGRINGDAVLTQNQTAYIIRLGVDVTDIIYRNSISNSTIRLYDKSDVVVEEWDATGVEHMIEGLEPGLYTMEVNGRKSTRTFIDLKDIGKLQRLSTAVWTIWDTISVVGALIMLALISLLLINVFRRAKRKKNANG